jgi:hypothetical protein
VATRLVKDMDTQGISRSKSIRTTIPDKRQPCPPDKVNRQFPVPAELAPNMLRVPDFTIVATRKGFAQLALLLDHDCRVPGLPRLTEDGIELASHHSRPGLAALRFQSFAVAAPDRRMSRLTNGMTANATADA